MHKVSRYALTLLFFGSQVIAYERLPDQQLDLPHQQQGVLDSSANPRKRPRIVTPVVSQDLNDGLDTSPDGLTDGQVLHTQKKYRPSEWPLKESTESTSRSSRTSQSSRKSTPPRRKRHEVMYRSSKFMEGSMNDKASKPPPDWYIREEEAREQYHTPGEGPTFDNKEKRVSTQDHNTYDAGIESSKPTGVFRFGKAIVSAFNPMHAWQGLSGMWKEKDDGIQQTDILQERKTKAETAYADLKASGFPGTKRSSRGMKDHVPVIHYPSNAEPLQTNSFRDSGIDMDDYRSSTDRETSIEQREIDRQLMPPPPIPESSKSISPLPESESAAKRRQHFSKPSLQSLKKIKSHIQLSTTKKESLGSSNVPITLEPAAEIRSEQKGLRRQASKKDLAKQQKLTKRVSNLESQLDVARRELEALQDIPTVPELPPKFGNKTTKRGRLPSLPSERLINPNADVQSHGGSQDQVQDGSALPSIETNKSFAARESASKKRKSGHGILDGAWYEPGNENSALAEPTASSDIPKQPGRSRKSQKTGEDTSPGSKRNKSHELPKTPTRKLRTISSESYDSFPSLPPMQPIFSPAKVDQAKVLSMRSDPNNQLPLGLLSDDFENLRKEYPSATSAEIDKYLRDLPNPKAATEYTSVSHQDRVASPSLGRPIPAPEMKYAIKKAKAGTSPPPPSLVSPKRRHIKRKSDATNLKATAAADTDKGEGVNGSGRTLDEGSKENEPRTTPVDKPLPGIQKEQYDWPEDVF